MANEEVTMMMSVMPGAMTGISTLMSGLVSINNVFMDMTRQIDATFGLIDSTVVTAGVVIGQFGLQAAEAFGEFEQGMKIVQMVSNQTAQDMDYLKAKANEFSVSYRVDIDQITEGLQTLGRAGLNSASEQTEVLQNGLSTAKLESRDLNGVLEELIQNTALLGGNLKQSSFGEDSTYINDLLVATSMTAPITTHDVSETLKYSGGIAAAAGANIRDEEGNVNEEGKRILEDYMGTISAFAQKGVTGSIAGTALRAFLNKPATQDSSVVEGLSMLNLKPEYLWEDDGSTMKPISQQIGLIQNQMDELNISTMDRLQIWSKIVGGKMGQQMMKLDSEDIKELTKDIRAADDASGLAAETMKTYQANMKEMTEQGQVAFRAFGERVATVLNPALDIITEIFKILSSPIVGTTAFIGFIGAMLLAFNKVKKIINTLKEEVSKFWTAMRSGEDLFSVRPSVIRGQERQNKGFSSYSAPKEASSAKDVYDAFKNTANSAHLEHLQQKGIKDAEIAVMQHTAKWSANFDEKVFGASWLDARGLKAMPGDNEIIKTLIAGGKWKNEWTDAMFNKETGVANKEEFMKQFGAEIYAEYEKYMNQAGNAAQNFANKVNTAANDVSREDYYKKFPKDFIADENPKKKGSNTHPQEMGGGVSGTPYDRSQNNDRDWNTNSVVPGYISPEALEWQKKQEEAARETKEAAEQVGKQIFPDGYPKPDWSGTEDFINYHLGGKTQIELNSIKKGLLDSFADSLPLMSELNGSKEFAKFYENNVDRLFTFTDRRTKAIQLPISQIAEDYMSFSVPNISKEEFGNFDAGGGRKINEIFKGKEFNQLYSRFNKMLEDGLREYMSYVADQIPTYPKTSKADIKYPSLDDIINDKTGKVMTKKELENVLTQKGIDYDSKMNKSDLAKLAYGHVVDWETMNWNDFRQFAKSEGVSAKGSRADIIARLNEKYANELSPAAKNWLDDYDKAAGNVAFRDSQTKVTGVGGQPELNSLAASAEDFREAAAQQVKAAEIQREAAENRRRGKGTGGDTTYDYMDYKDQRDAEKELREKKKQFDEYADMVTSSPDQVHKTSKEPDYSNVGKGASEGDKNKKLAFIDGSWRIIDVHDDKFVPPQSRPEKPKYDVTKGRDSIVDEYAAWGFRNPDDSIRKKISDKFSDVSSGVSSGIKGFFSNAKERLTADRPGRVLGYANATTRMQKFTNVVGNVTDMLGGPMMIAMAAFTAVVEYIRGLYEAHSQEVKQLSSMVSEAYSDMSEAESGLKQAYKAANPDSTKEDVENYMLDVYSQRYDDWASGKWQDKMTIKNDKELTKYEYDEEKDDGSYKEKEEEETTAEEDYEDAVKENTGALYAATAQLQSSMHALVTKMNDGIWGVDGLSTRISDFFGSMQDHFWGGEGSSAIEEGGLLLTASQKDSNYEGNTELAGLILEDFRDAKGDLSKGLGTMFGSDAKDILSSMNSDGVNKLQEFANFSAGNAWKKGQSRLTRQENMKMQQSMKMDKKSWQAGAKELAKLYMKRKSGKEVTEKDTRRLEGYIKKLATETGLSEIKVRQGMQLQQLQDMYAVAQQSMVPLAERQAQIAAQHYVLGGQTLDQTGGANYGANETASIAAIIASYVSVVAQAKAGEAYFEAQRQKGDPDALAAKDYNEYMSKGYGQNLSLDNIASGIPVLGSIYSAGKKTGLTDYAIGSIFGDEGVKGWNNLTHEKVLHLDAEHPERFYGQMVVLETMGEKARNPNWSDEQAQSYAIQKLGKYFDSSGKPLYNEDVISKVVRENYANAITPALLEQYMGSDIGETDDEGSGGGGGSGSGDKDKDKDSGTRKERVDLVLCNRKTIPKLNVNLFKKPPSFTILNKNFKLRDVRINSEDKPKAIMAAIKNSFIDIQKRTDPKIIQDEDAVYDPAAATDGTNVPSGSAKTNTS